MRKIIVIFLGLALGLTAANAGSIPAPMAADLPDIIAPLLPAVVNISVLKHPGSDPDGKNDKVLPDRALGSGFVITPDGFIVTNHHVVEGGYAVTISLNDGTTYPADIVAINQRPDLALLKIKSDKPFSHVNFGDSDTLRTGEPVIAIGNPLGLTSSVSVGVVSALNRDINMTMIDDFIQTDAAINHGNSGGPLFNLKGQVIGVNWALFAPGQQSGSAGLGFAIPSNDAAWVVGEMRRYGRLRAGFVGLRIQQITPDIEKASNLPSRAGGIVVGVLPDTPAAKSGLREGDVVLAIDGRTPRDVRALLRDLSASSPGASIALSIWRNGATSTVDVKVAEWPEGPYDPAGPPMRKDAARKPTPDLGLKLAVVGAETMAKSPFYAGRKAVAVTGVLPDSPAADLRLTAGDVILRVGDDGVASPEDVRGKLDAARAQGKSEIMMLVDAPAGAHWVVIPLTAR